MSTNLARRLIGSMCSVSAFALFVSPAGADPGAAAQPATTLQRSIAPEPETLMIRGQTYPTALLRVQHDARLRRFADAKAMGARAVISPESLPQTRASVRGNVGDETIAAGSPHAAKAFSKNLFVSSQIKPLNNLDFMLPLPKDAADFCTATGAAACLYFPSGIALDKEDANGFIDVDPYLKGSFCTNLGGQMAFIASSSDPLECWFTYPKKFLGNFDPGSAAKGTPHFLTDCTASFSVKTETRGAIFLAAQPSYRGQLTSPLTCLVRAF